MYVKGNSIMDSASIRKIIDQITMELALHDIVVNHIFLFGSQATAQADSNSDIDIAVVSESFNGKDIFQRSDMIYPANFCRKYPIDLLLMSLEEWTNQKGIMPTILREQGIEYQTKQT